MNKQEGRLALMYVRDWTGITSHIFVVLIVSSEQFAGEGGEPRNVDRSEQIDHAGNITGLVKVVSHVKHLLAAGCSQHCNEMPSCRFTYHCYFIWRIAVVVRMRLQPADSCLTI